LPGFTLIGGTVSLTDLLPPEDYAHRRELFRLEEYVERFRSEVAKRRCAHCSGLLKPNAHERRRYCSDACSQAARQKAYRQKQKHAALTRALERGANSAD